MRNFLIRTLGVLLMLPALCLTAQDSAKADGVASNERYVVSTTYKKGKLFRVLLDRQTKLSYVLDETVEHPHLEAFTVDKENNRVQARIKGETIEVPLVVKKERAPDPRKAQNLERAKAIQRNPNSEDNRKAMAWLLSKPGRPVEVEELSVFPEPVDGANLQEGTEQ